MNAVGASGAAMTMFPIVPRGTSLPSSSTMRTSNPGIGRPAEPGRMARGWFDPFLTCRAAWLFNASPEMGDPDSEDHQLSMTSEPGAAYCVRRS